MGTRRIAFVASEIAPFAKTGGLADVAAALPRYLRDGGHDVRPFMPRYAQVDLEGREVHRVEFAQDVEIEMGGRRLRYSLLTTPLPDSELWVYLIDCPDLYHREGIYRQDGDEHVRFAFLARASIESCQRMGWSPEVFHCNDWHAGLVPLYLRSLYGWDGLFSGTKSVVTIHNIAYQGKYPAEIVGDLGLSDHAGMLHQQDLRAGVVNYLKTGLLYADAITTVSPTYADEIRTAEYGEGLDALLRERGPAVRGILNGIDDAIWNPATDPMIPANYTPEDLSGKAECKRTLMQDLGLDPGNDAPLLGKVSRLTPQKGLDLYPEVFPAMLARSDARIAILGSGEARYERFLEDLQRRYPGRVCFYRGYHDELAHRIEAGADVFLMPSRFEPCGLNQMYSLKYGTPPLVRRTGGLADTVSHFDPETGHGNGFVFDAFDVGGLSWALRFAITLYRDRPRWIRCVLNGMAEDFSWPKRVAEYEALYDRITD